MIEDQCKNCNATLHDGMKYCPNCSQKTDTHRINLHFLVHEVQHGVFHVDKGILFTLKELFVRPGHTIREYIKGKRKRHFPPVALIMILGSLTLLANYYLNGKSPLFKTQNIQTEQDNTGQLTEQELIKVQQAQEFQHCIEQINIWLNSNYTIVMLLMIPLSALCLYLTFQWMAVYFVLSLFLTVWTMIQYYHHKKPLNVLLRTIPGTRISFAVYGILIGLAGFVYALIQFNKQP